MQLKLGYRDIGIFFAAAIFKSRLLKMAATVMTLEFCTIQPYSNLEENSEGCLSSSLNRYKETTEHHVNYDILILNNHVLNRNMNTIN